jgi:hypothetical protein
MKKRYGREILRIGREREIEKERERDRDRDREREREKNILRWHLKNKFQTPIRRKTKWMI